MQIEKLPVMTRKVLEKLEPDQNKWEYWLSLQPLAPILTDRNAKAFKERIGKAAAKGEKVLVFGDYDADGVLGASIMVMALRKLGIDAGFYIPDRIEEGYGLNSRIAAMAKSRGYALAITVDNGIKAHEALADAKKMGLEVIVTDHHRMEEKPSCSLLIHPDLMDDEYSTLCGAAIAYELARVLGADDDYMQMLAAAASVTDMMGVTGETRAIIQNGLQKLNASYEPHLRGLVSDSKIDEKTVGFQIGPKLNAVGRLSNMANSNNLVRYFLSSDPAFIDSMQRQITLINEKRKQMTSIMQKAAENKVSSKDKVIIVEDDSFHEGIIGLVAGSLLRQFKKPAIVLTKSQDGYKASMRAPRGFDCMEYLEGFEHYSGCGGHKEAAGFSFDLTRLDDFYRYARNMESKVKYKDIKTDTIEIEPEDITVEAVSSLDLLRPFGPGFEEPKFELKDPSIKSFFDIQNGKHRKYMLKGGLQCMRFNQPEEEMSKSAARIDSFIGTLQINAYQGRKSPAFIIEEIKYR